MKTWELAGQLLMSLVFGTIIGIERQWHHKTAGIKTNTLVAVGSTAFGLISIHGFGQTSNTTQIAAGVVTGIGFIGAGVIMRRAGNVQGINTAATLWATGSMGLAIGGGYYVLAPLLLITILTIQFALGWVASAVDRRSKMINPLLDYRLKVTFDAASVNEVRSIWRDLSVRDGVLVTGYSESLFDEGTCSLEASFQVTDALVQEPTILAQRLATLVGVKSASVFRAPPAEREF
ncbi:MAG TPA: MgtC/SapB family protein [Blastocatellia bacterium]|nr:MgtC/SapB family protein [Blastocatellia bacterium]